MSIKIRYLQYEVHSYGFLDIKSAVILKNSFNEKKVIFPWAKSISFTLDFFLKFLKIFYVKKILKIFLRKKKIT